MAALAGSVFAQGARSTFTTERGTQSAEFLAGVTYQHGNEATDPHYMVRLRGGLSRYVSGYFDFSYSRPFDSGPTAQPRVRESLMFFTPGVQLHIPIYKMEPYVIGGLGGARFRSTVNGGGLEDNRFAQSIGAGVRAYPFRYAGVSVEMRAIHINGFGWVNQYSAGVFGQF